MKNSIELSNYYESLRQLPDSYLPLDKYTKNYFVIHRYLFTYCYAPANAIYECKYSINSLELLEKIGNFLDVKKINLKPGCNFLNHIDDLAAFHQDFLKCFLVDNPIFYISHNYNPEYHVCNSEDSDSSSDEYDNYYSDMEIEIVNLSMRSETYLE